MPATCMSPRPVLPEGLSVREGRGLSGSSAEIGHPLYGLESMFEYSYTILMAHCAKHLGLSIVLGRS